MKYKARLEYLQLQATQKADVYVDIVRSEGMLTNSERLKQAKAEWEDAERVYSGWLDIIESDLRRR